MKSQISKSMHTFSIESALEAKRDNQLKEWAITFLNGEGNNKRLGQILKETDCSYVDLIELPLKQLTRVAGPEPDMVFKESDDSWERRIASLQAALREGYMPPPLIATDFWGDLHISDGSHRHEAFMRNGVEKYWVILFRKND
jgi:hypothetical protein